MLMTFNTGATIATNKESAARAAIEAFRLNPSFTSATVNGVTITRKTCLGDLIWHVSAEPLSDLEPGTRFETAMGDVYVKSGRVDEHGQALCVHVETMGIYDLDPDGDVCRCEKS